jgi:protein ImuB
MQWLALVFPQLPLDAQSRHQRPAAVAERGLVVAADDESRAAGIEAGMRVSTARARLPGLAVIDRDRAAEAALQAEIACCCGHFTPDVCLIEPDALLLEIGASLRLFGGFRPLRQAIAEACRRRVVGLHWGSAPTARAALWLARAAADREVATMASLPAGLAPLPIAATGWPAALQQQLAGFGARCLGDVLALPRPGLMRRAGAEVGGELARALGEAYERLPRFVFLECFRQELALPATTCEAGALRFAAGRLLEALCGWLAARQAGVSVCRLELLHEGRAASLVELRLQAPARTLERFRRLLHERLDRLTLPFPVAGLRLEAGPGEALPGCTGALIDGAAGAREDIDLLIERLRGRLGDTAIGSLACVADHRPEHAGALVAVGQRAPPPAVTGMAARPLWLRKAPQPLAERSGGLQAAGKPGLVLELASRAERIESGWWDDSGGEIGRDYFVARGACGTTVWVFRDHRGGGWFLHGRF